VSSKNRSSLLLLAVFFSFTLVFPALAAPLRRTQEPRDPEYVMKRLVQIVKTVVRTIVGNDESLTIPKP
jgi:hypothetical protein